MANFEYPQISSSKTSQQNIQALRVWANDTTDYLNILVTDMQNKIENLENQINSKEE